LGEGRIVVVPERAVELDGVAVTGWWAVDPGTGEVTDRLEDGRAGASVLLPYAFGDSMPGYARLVNWVVKYKKVFSCLGNTAGAGFAVGTAIVSHGAAQALAAASAAAAVARAIGACAG
jgi:hypothetical protein